MPGYRRDIRRADGIAEVAQNGLLTILQIRAGGEKAAEVRSAPECDGKGFAVGDAFPDSSLSEKPLRGHSSLRACLKV